MTIAFATAQSIQGSTNIGRILPLAQELAKKGHQCSILALRGASATADTKEIWYVGAEPFQRTAAGKERLKGALLVFNMTSTALRTTWALHRLKADVIIISKPLPANVLGVWLFKHTLGRSRIVLDTDDFELTANKLSSLTQRAVIHWSERLAAKLADAIVAASPFLADHFKQLTQNTKPIEIIATGIGANLISFERVGSATGHGSIANSDGETARTAERSEAPEQRTLGAARKAKSDNKSAMIAYLGSISVSSGHRVDLLPEILEQSVKQNPNIHLLIAGDGDDVAKLKEEFHRRGLANHVTWHGRFSSSEVEGLLASTTIILDPVDDSIANRSKSSFRFMAATAAGLPVISSNIGIRAELVPTSFHQRFFAEPNDAKSYAEKIDAIVQHPLSAEEAQELQNHAETYTWPQLAARYQKIIAL